DVLAQLGGDVGLARDHADRAGDHAQLVADGDADADLTDVEAKVSVADAHDPASGVGSGEADGTGWRSTLMVMRSAERGMRSGHHPGFVSISHSANWLTPPSLLRALPQVLPARSSARRPFAPSPKMAWTVALASTMYWTLSGASAIDSGSERTIDCGSSSKPSGTSARRDSRKKSRVCSSTTAWS